MREEGRIIGKLRENFLANVFSGLGQSVAAWALDIEARERGRLGRSARAKKDGTNGKAVRAGRPVTQTTPGWEGI